MGKLFWSGLLAVGVIAGAIAAKYFKIDDLDARQLRFEQITTQRFYKYDSDLSDVRIESRVNMRLLENIQKDTREIKQMMLNKK